MIYMFFIYQGNFILVFTAKKWWSKFLFLRNQSCWSGLYIHNLFFTAKLSVLKNLGEICLFYPLSYLEVMTESCYLDRDTIFKFEFKQAIKARIKIKN